MLVLPFNCEHVFDGRAVKRWVSQNLDTLSVFNVADSSCFDVQNLKQRQQQKQQLTTMWNPVQKIKAQHKTEEFIPTDGYLDHILVTSAEVLIVVREDTVSECKLSNCLSLQSLQFCSWRTQTVTRGAIRPANQSSP